MSTNSFYAGFATGAAVAVSFELFYKYFWNHKKNPSKESEDEKEINETQNEESEDEESHYIHIRKIIKERKNDLPKMVLCVRTDLGMQKGKMCAQCAHAALGAYQEGIENDQMHDIIDVWEYCGCAKIALKVTSLEELEKISEEATHQQINQFTVCDAGRTQIAPGSITVLALGPDYASKIDSITGPNGSHPLKLL